MYRYILYVCIYIYHMCIYMIHIIYIYIGWGIRLPEKQPLGVLF